MTANAFLLADLHRAQQRGDRCIEVPTVDLAQLLARLEQLEAAQAVAVCAPVGWANGAHTASNATWGAQVPHCCAVQIREIRYPCGSVD